VRKWPLKMVQSSRRRQERLHYFWFPPLQCGGGLGRGRQIDDLVNCFAKESRRRTRPPQVGTQLHVRDPHPPLRLRPLPKGEASGADQSEIAHDCAITFITSSLHHFIISSPHHLHHFITSSPITHHSSLITRHSSLVTRHPSPILLHSIASSNGEAGKADSSYRVQTGLSAQQKRTRVSLCSAGERRTVSPSIRART